MCPDNPDKIYYRLDDGGDPSFYCEGCGAEHNHMRKEYDDGHKCKVLGWTNIETIMPILKQGVPEGWLE